MTDAPTVNMDEMARRLGVSLPTFRNLMKDNADFPVEAGGSRGIPYEFDVGAVLDWKKRKVEDAQRLAADKHEFLSQFEFPIEDDAIQQGAVSPAARLKIAQAIKAERELEMTAGHLVHTAGVRQGLMTALTVLGKEMDNIPALLGREFNLPHDLQRALRKRLDEIRTRAVRSVQTAVGGNVEPESDHLLSAAE